MADLPATLVDDIDEAVDLPGAFEILRDAEGRPTDMLYICPCGCGHTGTLRLRPCDERPSWDMRGPIDRPTLTPSVHHILQRTTGGERTHWHGWLTAGVWRPC